MFDIIEELGKLFPQLHEFKDFLYFIANRDKIVAKFEAYQRDLQKTLNHLVEAFFEDELKAQPRFKEVMQFSWDYAIFGLKRDQLPLLAKIFKEGSDIMARIGAAYDHPELLHDGSPIFDDIKDLNVVQTLGKDFSEIEKARVMQGFYKPRRIREMRYDG